ncbi:MAG: hypothetical protein FIA99_05645 [Ruminiclostridium sp.]|nr:hypothetical protein [Ruminiclostridium sp.]
MSNSKIIPKTTLKTLDNNNISILEEDSIIFEKFVSNANFDGFQHLIDLVAYAEFSKQKFQFMQMYEKEEGRYPTEEEWKPFLNYIKYEDSEQIRSLKAKSSSLLVNFASNYADNLNVKNILEPIKKHIDNRTKFWISVFINLLATFFYSLLIAVVIFIATASYPESKFAQIIHIITNSGQ